MTLSSQPKSSLPLWTREGQLELYESIGYGKEHVLADGTTWRRPDETDRFLLNWGQRYHVVVCPRRASKSYSAAKKALPVILGRTAGGDGPRPTRTWIVGPTYELAEKEFRYIHHDLHVALPKLGLPPPSVSRLNRKGDMYLRCPWGSEVIGKSSDKPQSLLGEEVDLLIVSEAAAMPGGKTVWERFLEPTLTTTRGYALFPTTPDMAAGWLQELWTRGLAGTDDTIASYNWDVRGNPTYPLDELEAKRKFYGEDHPIFREQYLGQWVYYTGIVYGHDFDPSRNIRDVPADLPVPVCRDGFPLTWRRVRAIDFGYRDPFVCLWAAIAPDQTIWVYREYYQPQAPTETHAARLKHYSEGVQVAYTVADPSEAQLIADLRRVGIPAVEANNARRAGRMLVGDFFRSGKLVLVRGKCPNTVEELHQYRWKPETDRESDKEATLGNDHAMDALRYLVASRPHAPVVPDVPTTKGTFEGALQDRVNKSKKFWLGSL